MRAALGGSRGALEPSVTAIGLPPRPQQQEPAPRIPLATFELASPSNGTSTVVKKGFLWRESRKGWKMRYAHRAPHVCAPTMRGISACAEPRESTCNRYVELDHRAIAFYESAASSSTPTEVALLEGLTLANTNAAKHGRYAFQLNIRTSGESGEKREWVIAGQTETETLEWIESMIQQVHACAHAHAHAHAHIHDTHAHVHAHAYAHAHAPAGSSESRA